jgi:hypothetical protein
MSQIEEIEDLGALRDLGANFESPARSRSRSFNGAGSVRFRVRFSIWFCSSVSPEPVRHMREREPWGVSLTEWSSVNPRPSSSNLGP